MCHAINEITSRYTSVLLYGYVAHELWEKQAIISITQARRGIKCKVNVKCLYSLVWLLLSKHEVFDHIVFSVFLR